MLVLNDFLAGHGSRRRADDPYVNVPCYLRIDVVNVPEDELHRLVRLSLPTACF